MTEHINALAVILNAALEHCPPQTKQILTEMAQARITAMMEACKLKDEAKP